MKIPFMIASMACALAITACTPKQQTSESLKDALAGKFFIGTAMNAPQIEGTDTAAIGVITQHFNAIVAENCMKSEELQPEQGKFDFTLADKMIEFGMQNNMHIIGHTLIWHSQAPKWFFTDAQGNEVSRDTLIERMRTHIHTVVTRYKGRVKGWDVVNEAIEDDGSWRQSKFYKIVGEDFVRLAFEFAHEADPDAELYYNDYSMAHEGRRQGVINMVKSLQQQGVKIHGIGMQGHMSMQFPEVSEFEKSLVAFANLGVKVMITELDVSILPSPRRDVGADVALNYDYQKEMNPYTEGLPDSISSALHQRYLDFFKLFIKHHDKINRVTLWGVHDGQSWKNDWPMRGRTDYPLIFDRNYEPKPIVAAIIEEAKKAASTEK
ncbi:endo-1,4-beta-xylanase [Breznakibacter xylanolyticus]|nr:endo-1,4-beta-xylanase [Breznakibacter xylanolyticus]